MEELKNYQIQHNLNIKIENIKTKYICKFCKNIMLNPKISECLCRFCETCVNDFMNNNSNHNCPSCIENGRNVELVLSNDVETKQKINKLIINCLNNNCNIRCSVETMVNHLFNCDKSEVSCILNKYGCNVTNITSENMENHLLEHNENHLELIKKHIETQKNDTILRDTEIQDSIEMVYTNTITEMQNSIKLVNKETIQRATELEVSVKNLKIENKELKLKNISLVEELKLLRSNLNEMKTIVSDLEKSNGMQIFVKNMEGKTITIEISKHWKIAEIKKKIQDKLRISPEKQKLVFKGGILEDDKTVEDCQISDRCVITVIARLRDSFKIFARTMDGKTVTFEVTKLEKIVEIKKNIQDKIGLCPEEQKLVFQGGILEDDKTVEECQISEKSVINLVVRLRSGNCQICSEHCGEIQIFVRNRNGIKVSKNHRISDLRKIIEKKFGIKSEKQILKFNGRVLNDEVTIEEAGIVMNSVIDVSETF